MPEQSQQSSQQQAAQSQSSQPSQEVYEEGPGADAMRNILAHCGGKLPGFSLGSQPDPSKTVVWPDRSRDAAVIAYSKNKYKPQSAEQDADKKA